MFRPGEIEGASLAVERTFSDMELRIMDDIVRRIRINGEITRSADWQIHRLHELGASDMAVRGYIQSCLEYSEREMDELYYDVLRRGYYRDGAIYRQTGDDQIPFEENAGLQQLISAVSDQTSGEMKNITQSLGFAVRENGRLRFLPIADYYQRTLDGAMFDIASGAFDYNTVLRRVTKEMTNSGLRTVDYASGRSIRVESAARMCVMTGFSQLTAKINEQNADALGTEYFEVTYHGGARPEHQEWQGKVYKKDELYSICGLGAPDGLCGCNCYHDYFPFFPGISERAYTDEELDKMNHEENTPKEYHGREYTAYQATQRQRSLERSMRAQRQEIHLLQTGGADDEEIMLARGKYRALSAEYTHFSKAMGIPQQRERVTVDGLGSVGKGKYTETDEPAKIPSLGSRITDHVTDEERRELLSRGGKSTNSGGGNSTPNTLAFSGGSGIMKDSGDVFRPVTEESINKISKMNVFGDERDLKVVEEMKSILSSVKDLEVGVEILSIYDYKNMNFIKSHISDVSDGMVDPLMSDVPFISIHNHPSGGTFSGADIKQLYMRDNCISIYVVGNNGSCYSLTKAKDYNRSVLSGILFDHFSKGLYPTDLELIKACERSGLLYGERR